MIDKANAQIKSSAEQHGDIIVDQSDAAPGGADQPAIEQFLKGKMTDTRLRNVDYLEVIYKVGSTLKRTFMVRTADGKANGPFTETFK